MYLPGLAPAEIGRSEVAGFESLRALNTP